MNSARRWFPAFPLTGRAHADGRARAENRNSKLEIRGPAEFRFSNFDFPFLLVFFRYCHADIDGGQQHENVRLQKRDENVQRRKDHRHADRN